MRRLRPGPWLWCPLVLLVDFLSKRYVLAHQAEFAARIRVLGDVARFAYVRNPGAAMGLLPGGRWLLVTVSSLLAVVLVRAYVRTSSAVRRGALAAVLGGALGNLVDRIFYGGLVVDFIDLGIGRHRFYTFNVADMGVTIGGAVLLWSLWRADRGGDTLPDTASSPATPPPSDGAGGEVPAAAGVPSSPSAPVEE